MQDVPSMELNPPPSRSPSPELLPSDDEDAVPVIPVTLRQLPWSDRYLPSLPPKHTYLRTPVRNCHFVYDARLLIAAFV